MKVTNKTITELVRIGAAVDMTDYSYYKLNDMINTHKFIDCMYSIGTYGCNGIVLMDKDTHLLYAVTKRNTNLFILF